jgi:membrane protease YdiL (CAAX protease family)
MVFFVLTFVWTWALYTPIAVGGHNPYQMPWAILLMFGGMGPSVIGLLMVLFTLEKEARRNFWRRCFSFKRISRLWWMVIFLLFPVLYALAILIDLAMGGSLPEMTQLRSLIANPLMIPLAAFISFMSGPWSEEFGWRGYALDRMLSPFGLLAGSIILGLIWGVWHLPLFFMPATWHGQIGFGLTGFWTFMLRSVGMALLMTWVYLSTDRSILSGMFMHFTSNFTSQLLASVSERMEVLVTVFIFLFGLTACLLMNGKRQNAFQLDSKNMNTGKVSS